MLNHLGLTAMGRVLGEVFVDGNNVNLEMVKAGLAEFIEGLPPLVKILGHIGRLKRGPKSRKG